MRLIDADALKTIQSIQSADYNSIETIQHWIDNAPTIDAVSVVNCINCIQIEMQSETTNCHTKGWCFCKKWKSLVSPVGFCNFGERKDNE